MRRILTMATALLALNSGAATFPIVYSFTNTLWYTNSATDPKTVVSVVVQTTGAVQNALTISTFQGGTSNLAFSVASTTNFRAAVWASATNDYAVKLFTGDRLYIAQTFTNRAFATISLLTSPDSSSGGGAVRVIASGVTNSSAGAIILTGDAVGMHTQSGSNSTLVLRANPTNMASERATISDLDWDGTLFTSPEDFRAGYINAVGYGTGTDPGNPKGTIVLVKSGSGDDYTVSTRYIYGVGGIIITNDPNGNTVINGGNSTGTVEAFFPKSNTAGVGRLYFSAQASPNNYTYLDLQNTNSGAVFFDGTNLYLGSFLIATASNSALFAGFLPAYYHDAQRLTNLVVMEEGATIATSLLGFNGGTNVTLSMETWTNSSGTVGQRVTISAGSGGSNYLLNAVNTWTESNSFEKTMVAPQITLNGSGRSMSGLNATVGIRGTNISASGAHSTAAGGRSATASGDDSTVSGGNANTASGSGSTAGGGSGNTASGAYSLIPGGYNNTASGDYSLAALFGSTASGLRSAAIGTYVNAAGTDTVVIGVGQASTNLLTRYGPRRVYIDSYQTNMGLSVATTNATHAVEVGGTVRAAAFLGDGSGLSGLPSTAVTGVLTSVIYTNYDLLYLTAGGGLQLYVNTNTPSSVTDAVSRIVANAVTSSPRLVRFMAGGSISQEVSGTESTVYLPSGSASGGGISATSTYGVAIVGSDTNTFIVDPGSASNLVLMSSGAGFVPQFRVHPWASSSSVASAVGALSNATFGQTWASTASVAAAAQIANATSVNGQAWSASPGVGDLAVWNGSAWIFTNVPPASSTGSVSGIAAGTNVMVGSISVVGTMNIGVTSTEAVGGQMTLDGTWTIPQDAGSQGLSNLAWVTSQGNLYPTNIFPDGFIHLGGRENKYLMAITTQTVDGAVVLGGDSNRFDAATMLGAAYVGGRTNVVNSGTHNGAGWLGGENNTFQGNSYYSGIVAGHRNYISNINTMIGAGEDNYMNGSYSGGFGRYGTNVGSSYSFYWGIGSANLTAPASMAGGDRAIAAASDSIALGSMVSALHRGSVIIGGPASAIYSGGTRFGTSDTNTFTLARHKAAYIGMTSNDLWTLIPVKIVTNAHAPAFTPYCAGAQLIIVGTNERTAFAVGPTTNDWRLSPTLTAP